MARNKKSKQVEATSTPINTPDAPVTQTENSTPQGWDKVETSTENTPVETPKAEKISAEQKAINKAKLNMAKYPHAQPETIRRDTSTGKMLVDVKCTKTGVIFTVYTSDVFQCSMCPEAREQAKKDARAQNRLDVKAGLALLRAQKAEANA